MPVSAMLMAVPFRKLRFKLDPAHGGGQELHACWYQAPVVSTTRFVAGKVFVTGPRGFPNKFQGTRTTSVAFA